MPAASMTRLSDASWKPCAANSSRAARRIACCWAGESFAKRRGPRDPGPLRRPAGSGGVVEDPGQQLGVAAGVVADRTGGDRVPGSCGCLRSRRRTLRRDAGAGAMPPSTSRNAAAAARGDRAFRPNTFGTSAEPSAVPEHVGVPVGVAWRRSGPRVSASPSTMLSVPCVPRRESALQLWPGTVGFLANNRRVCRVQCNRTRRR
jgi:hypothetical protein